MTPTIMIINSSLNRLRLYKNAQKQKPRQNDSFSDEPKTSAIKQERRHRKDRRQRRIGVLLNRRCSHERRNQRMLGSSGNKNKTSPNRGRINTRA